ncbi:HAD family acid phosphatase [Streptoalloteichus hindustanus]|uniref:HAD superfamily, subfamily IIIB (Acid phosphatase) n=1 Tax=Streptoalloteichus hindustanus TaxID=2017 RepID=A0A1M5F774_STRHI|nr:HAD family acid phosphatase [Streptoalloteichus hindustanus]SHF87347.1 HAD superfamily, subfamily IIIB (Acid phosphatase) [Streptoalloteichus hindustanus]
MVRLRTKAVGLLVSALAMTLTATTAHAAQSDLPSYEQWQRDVRESLEGVHEYLDSARGRNAAIVLDIDNTALETEYHRGRANKPVLEAARHAKRLGMTVLIVSARKVGHEESALDQLRRAGYEPDKICLKRKGERNAEGKLRCRKKFTAEGYRITANIGNRDTDFEGGYYDRRFQLPDYDGELS